MSDKLSFQARVVAGAGPDKALETNVLDEPLLKLVGHVLHDKAKLDIHRFVPSFTRVPLTGEVSQVILAAAVGTAGKNLCDKVLLVLVKRNHWLILTVLSSGRINSPSSTILEGDTDDVVDALGSWCSRVLRRVEVEQQTRAKYLDVNLFDLDGVAYARLLVRRLIVELVDQL